MRISGDYWKGKRVLLTGHTGFKGSWLSLWLSHMQAEVHGYALAPPSNPSLFEVARVSSRLASHRIADIRDLASLRATFDHCKPEIVIHMAAQPLVLDGYADPVGTYATNVMGTVHVLEAVRGSPTVRVALVVSSDKCYENKGWAWGYRETDRLGGHDPYSNSKACTELVTSAYRSSFFGDGKTGGVPVIVSARAGNVIGGGDWARDRLIPDLVRAFSTSRIPVVRSPHAVRPWQHVLEPLSGYLGLVEAAASRGAAVSGGWNFGPGPDDARPVKWIADRLVQYWGGGTSWETDAGAHPHEAAYLYLDSSRSAAELHYRPRWKLDAALERLVAWYKAHLAGEDMRACTIAQIEMFQAAGRGSAG